MKSTIALGVAFILALAGTSAYGAEGFAQGHGALEVFDGVGFAAAPLWVRIWVGLMIATFAVGLFVFAWKRPLARWAAGGFLVSAMTGQAVFSALGLPFLSGSIAIMHLVCWTPALVLLLIQRPFLDASESKWFRAWSAAMTFAILFSFVFDIRDAFIYIAHFADAA